MQADFFNYPLQDFLHLSLMHLVLVIGRQNAGWKVLALSGLAGFLCSGLFICAGMFPCCVGVIQLFSGTEVHIWICLHALLVIVQVPACHHLSMRNSNCRPKVNSLVKWFLEDTLWSRDCQMSVWICLCSLWGVGKALLSSLLTSETMIPVFVHFSVLSLLYCLSLKTKPVWCSFYRMTHPKPNVESRSMSICAAFLVFCFLCLLRLLFLSSVHRLMLESAFLLWIIYRSAGLGAVTSHKILKSSMNFDMRTAALEEGAVSQNSYLIKLHKNNFFISVLWFILCSLRAYLTNPLLFNSFFNPS